ncbi:MAG: hypothetical protein IT184_18855 [Acidobacteria bacterium]|nr:hypothetical protein [Acidobacteriota bacterium]
MKRTTIFIPEELERGLQIYAGRVGKPVAFVVREAIAAYIAETPGARVLPSFARAFDSRHSDTAERQDELVFRGLAPHGDDTRPRRRNAPAGDRKAPRRRRVRGPR